MGAHKKNLKKIKFFIKKNDKKNKTNEEPKNDNRK